MGTRSVIVTRPDLVARRLALELTQYDVARAAGIARGALADLECGRGGSRNLQDAVEAALERAEHVRRRGPPEPARCRLCGEPFKKRSVHHVFCRGECQAQARGLFAVPRPVEARRPRRTAAEAEAQLRRYAAAIKEVSEARGQRRTGLAAVPAPAAGWFSVAPPALPLQRCDVCGGWYRGAPAWRVGGAAACAAHDAWDVARWYAGEAAADRSAEAGARA